MSRRFALAALLTVLAVALASVALAASPAARPTPFPVTITARTGRSRSPKRPSRIVSLSPTATETLFAIGAGPQVVAVDDQSDYPKSAPRTTLSGFTPNVEAIAALPARPRRHLVRPEGALRGARDGSGSRSSSRTRRRTLQGRVPADPPAREGHGPRAPRPTALVARMKQPDRRDRRETRDEGVAGLTVYHELDPDALLGHVEHVRRPGLRAVRPEEHRRRREGAAPATRSSRPSTSSRRTPT